MKWYRAVLKKYAVFSGRARRAEYWYFVLFNFLIYIGLSFIDGIFGTYNSAHGTGILSGLYGLAVLIPGLAVLWRRLHDTGRSGWYALLNLIPLVGAIVLIVFLAQDSQPVENKYGPNPKGAGTGTAPAAGVS
jgi:uncharacterized membrane protein YhaH (DUF805 family)